MAKQQNFQGSGSEPRVPCKELQVSGLLSLESVCMSMQVQDSKVPCSATKIVACFSSMED